MNSCVTRSYLNCYRKAVYVWKIGYYVLTTIYVYLYFNSYYSHHLGYEANL